MQFAREGARVSCVDLSADAAEETAQIIRGEGFEAIAVAADVTELDSVSATVARTCEVFGGIDILHNNVGVTHMGGPVELDEERFRASVDLNIGSVYRTAKAVLPVMLAQGGGAIVNISSLASIRWTGYPYFAYYAMKAAVNQATVALAMQYARQGIRANVLSPGPMLAGLFERHMKSASDPDRFLATRANRQPSGRILDPGEVARAALFLLCDASTALNGAEIVADGGLTTSFDFRTGSEGASV